MTKALVVDDLSVEYRVESRGYVSYVPALRHISLTVDSGQALGILGETGSGKSSLGMAIMRLLPATARVTGKITLGDQDLTAMPRKTLEKVRGRDIGLIFQDPTSALNPVRTVGAQIAATARAHDPSLSRAKARELAGDTLESLGVARERLDSYPHQLSGGMRQRALIATVMVTGPKFLIADEPTASLDKVTERQIVQLLQSLQRERQLGFMLISHDIGIVAALCRDVAVIYRGRLVESGPVAKVLGDPQHPYTQGLVRASRRERDERGRLVSVPRGLKLEEVPPSTSR
jgi:ABC-type dipeptide/oligopeptide/nickel transport system ATPase component